MPSLCSRIRAAHLACLLGDALGRPFEMQSPRDPRLRPGLDRAFASHDPLRYSDDSEMMIAVAESLARCGDVAPDDLLATLASGFDPARGYGHGMRLALEAARRGTRSVAFIAWPEGSKGNGGAVRVVPIACRYHRDIAHLTDAVDRGTAITHVHPDARAAAVAHALAIAHALTSEPTTFDPRACLSAAASAPLLADGPLAPKLALVGELLASGADSGEAGGRLGNGVLAEEAVPLALFCFLRSPMDFVEIVRSSILAGGDSDTVAAMSASLGGALLGEDALPAPWIARLENGPRGREHVVALADALLETTDTVAPTS